MPIFDYKCKCGKEKLNKLVKKHDETVKCDCGKKMYKKICSPNIGGMDNIGRSK
jgi:predicted nucleic acid-binding Zn ribbon protein